MSSQHQTDDLLLKDNTKKKEPSENHSLDLFGHFFPIFFFFVGLFFFFFCFSPKWHYVGGKELLSNAIVFIAFSLLCVFAWPRRPLLRLIYSFIQPSKAEPKAIPWCDSHGLQLLCGLGSIVILWCNASWLGEALKLRFSDQGNLPGMLEQLVTEVAIGFGVAGLVSYIFDVSYHKELIDEPMKKIAAIVDRMEAQARELQRLIGEPVSSASGATAENTTSILGAVEKMTGQVTLLEKTIASEDKDGKPVGLAHAVETMVEQVALLEKTIESEDKDGKPVGLAHAVETMVEQVALLEQTIEDKDKDGKPVGGLAYTVTKLNNDIKDRFTPTLDRLDISVAKLTNQMGFVAYREQVRKSYQTAQTRIVSIADYWMIDDEWWPKRRDTLLREQWQRCPLFQALTIGRKDDSGQSVFPRQITFAGKAAWPQNHEGVLRMDAIDFERFLGIVWRLVIMHKVRIYAKEQHESGNPAFIERSLFQVLIAHVPVAATIVDEKAFLLLEEPKDFTLSHGTLLTSYPESTNEEETIRQNRSIADSYFTLVNGYLHQARSAREYVEAVLCLSMVAAEISEDKPADEFNLKFCLEQLGMKDWSSYVLDHAQKKTYVGSNSADDLCYYATQIVLEYVKTIDFLGNSSGVPNFGQLKNDLL